MGSRTRFLDRVGIALSWAAGLTLLVAIVGIVVWLGINGASKLSWSFLTADPSPGSLEEGVTGGIRGPIFGTLALVVIGVAMAFPIGVGTAVFLTEYRRPVWLARAVESAVEVIFGVPSIVFALFGLAVFTSPLLGFLSQTVESSGLAYGRSFLVAGVMMSLLALPPITRATEESVRAIPRDLKEASYALGKTRLATLRRVILPGARPGMATGTVLGAGKIAGDTAIVWLLLGGVITFADGWYHPGNIVHTLQGTGATLTTYIYFSSPVGDGNNETAAYGAAFVLILLMMLVNGGVILLSRRGGWRR